MVSISFFGKKLSFASTCNSTWPHGARVTPYIAGGGATLAWTPLTQLQFYGAGTVWFVLQLVSRMYSIKPTCCQNIPPKSVIWMHLHEYQYLYCADDGNLPLIVDIQLSTDDIRLSTVKDGWKRKLEFAAESRFSSLILDHLPIISFYRVESRL